MHVVRHACIAMQLSACLCQRLSEPMQIRKTILIAKETRFAVMVTWYDVQRDIIQVNALSRMNPFYHKIIEPGSVGSPRFSLGQAVILDQLIEAPEGREQVRQS
jgi:hypothetical protein